MLVTRGALERLESACRIEPGPFTHCAKPLQKSPNNQQQLPLLRQSSPGINKPPNSSHTGAATCRPVNCTESSSSTELQPRHCFISFTTDSHYQVYGRGLPWTIRV